MSTRSSIKVDKFLHDKIVQFSEIDNLGIQEIYDLILVDYIKRRNQDEFLESTQLELLIKELFKKMDVHLASMIARNQMDISIILVSLMEFLYHFYDQEHTQVELYNDYRVKGVNYFKGKDSPFGKKPSRDELEE